MLTTRRVRGDENELGVRMFRADSQYKETKLSEHTNPSGAEDNTDNKKMHTWCTRTQHMKS